MDTLNYIILVKIGTKFLGRLYWNHHKQQNNNKTINNKTIELVNNVSIFYSGKLERQLNLTTTLKITQIVVAL